jgi:hypothetical protein
MKQKENSNSNCLQRIFRRGNDLMAAINALQAAKFCKCPGDNLCKKCLKAYDMAVIAAYGWENVKEEERSTKLKHAPVLTKSK